MKKTYVMHRQVAIVLGATILLVTASGYAGTIGLTLVVGGKPMSSIVLPAKPTRAARLGAFELQHHVRLMTGATLPMVTEGSKEAGRVRVMIGATGEAAAAGLKPDSWEPQEYAVRFRGNTLILAGQDEQRFEEVKYGLEDPFAFRTWPGPYEPQGTLHAVYHFLEHSCGVRWFDPTEAGTHVPEYDTLIVPARDVRRSPAFPYRDIGHFINMAERYPWRTILWKPDSKEARTWEKQAFPSLHKRYPGRWQYIHAQRGQSRLFLYRKRLGGCEPYVCNHSFYGYYERFLKKHPDWFAKGYGEAKPPQMCYTNKDFIAQVVQDARDYFDGKGKKQNAQARGDYFGLCPMDNSAYCKCDECRKWYASDIPRVFSNGSRSDYLWQFYNQVAREVGKSHPDKYLSVLAYACYAHHPTRVAPEKNVSVQLCLHVRNVYDTAMQENDLRFLDQWTRDPARRVFLWLYYCFPKERGHRAKQEWRVFPGFFSHHAAQVFKLYHRKGVRGAFFNGLGNSIDLYLTYAMLDDPSRSANAVLDEYVSGYFGAAAEPMNQFYLLVEKTYCDPENYQKNKNGTVGHQTQRMAWSWLGTAERMAALGRHIEDAKRLAQTNLERKRVELFEMAVWRYMKDAVHHVEEVPRMERWKAHPARLERLLNQKPALLADNALADKAFEAETPGIYFVTQQGGKSRVRRESCPTFADGQLGSTFVQGGEGEVRLRCDLGAVPPRGRQLRRVRLVWSVDDSARNRLAVQLFVRDDASKEWTAISRVIERNAYVTGLRGYYVLTLPFPERAITGFDALRIVDLSHLRKRPTTRFCEIEAEITPTDGVPPNKEEKE